MSENKRDYREKGSCSAQTLVWKDGGWPPRVFAGGSQGLREKGIRACEEGLLEVPKDAMWEVSFWI